MSEQDASATETETEVQETTEEPTAEEIAALADPGKQALDRMKEQREAAKAQAASLKAELDALKAETALRDKPAEEQEIERAKAEARQEALAVANQRILRSELRALATGKLADPSDAALYIDLDKFPVSEDGDTDSDALSEAIDDLLTRKPHLAAGKQSRFDGAVDQGAKGKDAKPGQITVAQLETMSTAEINQARREGRLSKALSGQKT